MLFFDNKEKNRQKFTFLHKITLYMEEKPYLCAVFKTFSALSVQTGAYRKTKRHFYLDND